jgi:hypothetical protein
MIKRDFMPSSCTLLHSIDEGLVIVISGSGCNVISGYDIYDGGMWCLMYITMLLVRWGACSVPGSAERERRG